MLIGVTLWTAAHDDAVVIEAFSVPPDMAARGVTGQAVAARLQDKLAALQDATDSARPADSYANNWGDDIKVQIPDTGVSVSEFYRLLVSWLGARRISQARSIATPRAFRSSRAPVPAATRPSPAARTR